MPSGAKPKVYPAWMVAGVESLYAAGHTQREIADRLRTTQKVVWNLMRRHGIEARVAAKRDQAGSANTSWKGDEAGYTALHKRVEVERGTPKHCDECGTENPLLTYDWANLTGDYADVQDFARMCRPCHRRFDNARRLGGDAGC